MRSATLAIALSFLATEIASAQVVGPATVLSSDTLLIRGQTFQLFGVDGIEFHQFCYVDGDAWACGASATRALQVQLDQFVVSCVPQGEAVNDVVPAVCSTDEGDVAELLTRRGWALAYRAQSEDYVAAEADARAEGEGVWRGTVVEPWVFREDMAAIEQRLTVRMFESLAAEAEAILTAERGGVPIFEGFETEVGPSAVATESEFRVSWLGNGYILDAIEERGVFDWRRPAAVLAAWQNELLDKLRDNAVASVLVSLSLRGAALEADSAGSYYDAIRAGAADWAAAGRQPVLLIAAPGVPEWITAWFSGDTPEGAEITQKPDIADPRYLGTIDGIDVFHRGAPGPESHLFPSDILTSVGYVTGENGRVVDLVFGDGDNPSELIVRYLQALQWRDESIVTIRYPYEPPAAPYGSGE